jgi:SM-20-related protein
VLTIFKVPRQHSVGFVAPFAAAPRHSITGWLRNDPPNAGGAADA